MPGYYSGYDLFRKYDQALHTPKMTIYNHKSDQYQTNQIRRHPRFKRHHTNKWFIPR